MDLIWFACLFAVFAVALFLYGLWIYRSGNYDLIPRGNSTSPKDKRSYAKQFGKVIMWVSLAPFLGATTAVIKWFGVPTRPIAIVMIGDFVLFIFVGVKVFFIGEKGK